MVQEIEGTLAIDYAPFPFAVPRCNYEFQKRPGSDFNEEQSKHCCVNDY